jgi:hypothetical protein
MKKTKIIYWISTSIAALFDISGVFFMNSQQATEGANHLGLPMWFHTELTIGKCIGGILIILPFIPSRIKEWAYVALGIDIISAAIAMISVDGFVPMSFSPLIAFVILLTSYITYHRINAPTNRV